MRQLSYIKAFNNKVKELIALYPNKNVSILINKYKTLNKYPDFYSALDNLGCKIGLEFSVETHIDKNDNFYFVPYVKSINKNNIQSTEIIYVNGEQKFKSLSSCYSILAKEYVYLLETRQNIELI